jgi:AraC-like DNA-binding protein
MPNETKHPNGPRLIDRFPDFAARDFNQEVYDRQFMEHNVIIKASSRDVSYPEHWGPLSIKCCFNGKENYRIGKRFYTVHDQNFLVLNQGQHYSSYIFSEIEVQSFTLNFTEELQSRVTRALLATDSSNLDMPFGHENRRIIFTEKLFYKNESIMPRLLRLRDLCNDFHNEYHKIEEQLYLILERLMAIEQELGEEMDQVDVLKPATKKELYRRLYFVKDYLDSCYPADITLDDMSAIANLNSAYLLKIQKVFSITPRQYLIKKRMEAARGLLMKTNHSITEICMETGYSDLTSFSKLFKHFYHSSPETFRKQVISS